jgi:GT2 family glycosyltransferase
MYDSFSILIPTHNRADILRRTLQSLSQVRVPPGVRVETIVVANACTDGTEAMVDSVAPGMPFPTRVVAEPRVGASVARNRAIDEAQYEVLGFFDDDVWVDPGWLEAMRAVYREYPADLVGGRVHLWWEAVQPPPWMFPGLEIMLSGFDLGDEVKELREPIAISANMAIHRRAVDRIGGFPPDLDRRGKCLMGGGETDLQQRAMSAGFRLFYAPGPWVKHWVAPHRLGRPYLHRLAFDFGRTAALMRPAPRSRAGWCPLIVGQPLRAGVNLCGAAVARVRGDRPKAVARRLAAVKRLGVAAGAVQRMVRGNSPAAATTPSPRAESLQPLDHVGA